jgi:uncharacterized YccA/Bax inhibitor family protein
MAFPIRRSSRPGLNSNTFANLPQVGFGEERMTVQGTVNKGFLLLVVLMASALWPWSQYMSSGNVQAVSGLMLLGLIGGLVLALIISFKATLAPYLAVPYAALEGLAIGGISAVLEQRYPGIAIEAVGLTLGVLAVLLVAYKAHLIRVTDKFRAMVVGATGGILLLFLATWILSFFHVAVPVLYSSTPLGIGITLVIVAVAALNLVLDFDLIERGATGGAPRYMEWYSAFALILTLVWLYIEMLQLLGQIRRD